MATLLDPALLTRYAELEVLIHRALDAIARGDRPCAILLSSAVVQKTSALDRRLRLAGLLPECP